MSSISFLENASCLVMLNLESESLQVWMRGEGDLGSEEHLGWYPLDETRWTLYWWRNR